MIDLNSFVEWMLADGRDVPAWATMGVTDPMLLERLGASGPWTRVNGRALLKEARTLRERAFARLVWFITANGRKLWLGLVQHTMLDVELGEEALPLRELLAYCQEHEQVSSVLSTLSIAGIRKATASANDEVVVALQDLADAIAWEGSEAFTADYYPRPQEVAPLTDEHVRWVMLAMQRELDRESRGSRAAHFLSLPLERQHALAERRRLWFARFGITPERWATGTWSLWEVSDELTWPPEGYYCAWDTSHPDNSADSI